MHKLSIALKGLCYSFHVIVHPFDGFWDLKKEKRGNMWSASVILLLLIVVFVIKAQVSGFIVNYSDLSRASIVQQVAVVLLPFFLWCVSNWCITTLMDGEGSFRDIAITTAYALTPLVLINIPMIILSNFITKEEIAFYALLNSISIGWAALLLFVGIMTVHQFSVSKTLATIAIAVVGMVVILFLGLLFVSILQQVLAFLTVLYKEIAMRK